VQGIVCPAVVFRASNGPERVFFRTLPRRGQRTPLRLVVSRPGSLVFVEGDRLSNSFGLWALSKNGGVGAFLFAWTNRTTHARSYQVPDFSLILQFAMDRRRRRRTSMPGTATTSQGCYSSSCLWITYSDMPRGKAGSASGRAQKGRGGGPLCRVESAGTRSVEVDCDRVCRIARVSAA
jgi:hypothetical protein